MSYRAKALVSKEISWILDGCGEGAVLLSTSKGVYYQCGGHVLMLTDARFGLTPIGIGLEDLPRVVSALSIQNGQPVTLRNRTLQFPGGTLTLEIEIVPQTLPAGAPIPQKVRDCATVLYARHKHRGVSVFSAPLLLGKNTEALDTGLHRVAYPLLSKLLDSLREGHHDAVDYAVSQLVGLGVGLTPSLDDCLLGMLYGLLRTAPESRATRMLKDAVIKYAPGGTHEISAAYLKAVAEGAPFGRLDSVLRGLSGEIPLDIEPVLEIGSSSGSEMLLGLLLAVNICAAGNSTERGALCNTLN